MKRILILMLAIASAPLLAMNDPMKILAREALIIGELEPASAFIQVLQKKGINPGGEVMGIIQQKNMGIPLALMALKKNHDLTLQFLCDHRLIKENDEGLSKGFESISDKYFDINETTPQYKKAKISEPEKVLIKRGLYGYLKLATKINQKKIINPNLALQYSGPRSLLLDAAYAGDTAIIALLIKLGVDVNARVCGSTALTLACAARNNKQRINVIKMLLEAGADPKINDVDGYSPIMRIILHTDDSADAKALSELSTGIKLLLEYGANLDIKTTILERTTLDILKSKGERFKIIIPLITKVD
jgi:hypothetical protein